MKIRILGIGVLILVLLAGSGLSMGQKGKTSLNIPLVIQFANDPGDKITSPYTFTDGVGGVTAYFNNDSTQDLILRASSGTPITYAFDMAFCGTTFPPGVTQGTTLTVFKAGSLAEGGIGEFAAKMETSGATGSYRLSFGAMDTETNPYLSASKRVVVWRQTADKWIVSTTTGLDDACHGEEGGDKADLMKYVTARGKTSLNQVGYYHMPFQFTATRKP